MQPRRGRNATSMPPMPDFIRRGSRRHSAYTEPSLTDHKMDGKYYRRSGNDPVWAALAYKIPGMVPHGQVHPNNKTLTYRPGQEIPLPLSSKAAVAVDAIFS